MAAQNNDGKYDLVMVGTGFASTFFLLQYLKKAGPRQRILVLERGYFFSHAERRRMLATGASHNVDPNPQPHETFVNDNSEKQWAFTIGFGGSSNCWYGCTPRFLPSDFRMRTQYGVAQDWPVQYDELEPYYSAVEQLMGISGPEETPFPKSR